ncbi:Stromal cell-derived factor 2-like protein [Camellia lanceoleosa]|uniref:Stromal cell-derived factor 2-like protein n=1 Tax=Camellia lanceoleosa TaxID=1840588 RepID=A0ACC0GRL4_9ERIC|nr:Stromal cell-derived factor 2-like protein [Camellia lanceoleosa]
METLSLEKMATRVASSLCLATRVGEQMIVNRFVNSYNIVLYPVLKLMHEKVKVWLHSHEVPYGYGSGQQSVTGFPVVDDSNSYWVLRESTLALSSFSASQTSSSLFLSQSF